MMQNSQIDAQLKLIFEAQTQKPKLGSIWVEGYQTALRSNDTEPTPPEYYYDDLEIEYWTQGWYAGFYREPIQFYNKSDFNPMKWIKNQVKKKSFLKRKTNSCEDFFERDAIACLV